MAPIHAACQNEYSHRANTQSASVIMHQQGYRLLYPTFIFLLTHLPFSSTITWILSLSFPLCFIKYYPQFSSWHNSPTEVTWKLVYLKLLSSSYLHPSSLAERNQNSTAPWELSHTGCRDPNCGCTQEMCNDLKQADKKERLIHRCREQ